MKNDYFSFGLKSTAGSLVAMSLVALPALIGILLVMRSKDKDTGERNNTMFWIGAALIIITALPFLPVFGLSLLTDTLTE
jgi:hypothetical protein